MKKLQSAQDCVVKTLQQTARAASGSARQKAAASRHAARSFLCSGVMVGLVNRLRPRGAGPTQSKNACQDNTTFNNIAGRIQAQKKKRVFVAPRKPMIAVASEGDP